MDVEMKGIFKWLIDVLDCADYKNSSYDQSMNFFSSRGYAVIFQNCMWFRKMQ